MNPHSHELRENLMQETFVKRRKPVKPEEINAILEKLFSKWERDIPRELLIDGLPVREGEKAYMYDSIWRYTHTLNLIPLYGHKIKVLEIGIGYGHLSILTKRLFGYEVSGIDIKKPETDYLKTRFNQEKIDFKICDLTTEHIPFENDSFDMILLCEVMEHLYMYPGDLISSIRRLLKKGGVLILTTPNFLRLYNRIYFLFGKVPRDLCCLRGQKGTAHVREYLPSELISFLNNNHFKVLEARYVNTFTAKRKSASQVTLDPMLECLLPFYCALSKVFPTFRNDIIIKAVKK